AVALHVQEYVLLARQEKFPVNQCSLPRIRVSSRAWDQIHSSHTCSTTGSRSLRGVAIVVVEHSTESFTPPDLAGTSQVRRIGHDEPVAESLVMAFSVIMNRKFLDTFSQRILTEEDHSAEARFLYGPNKSLGIGVQVRRSRW